MRTPRPWALPERPTTTEELHRVGVSEKMLLTQLRSGRLVRLRQGVYLAAAAWPDGPDQQHLMLAYAEVAANSTGVLSHQSAAVAWRLPAPGFNTWAEERVSLTLPSGTGVRPSHTKAAHHVAALPRTHLAVTDAGYPVTSLARTAIDLAAPLPLPRALVIVDAAARRLCESYVGQPRREHYANPAFVREARSELVGVAIERRRTGLRPVIELADPGRESAAESLSAGWFHLAGLPAPTFQTPIRTPIGTFFPDCLWAQHRVIGECDGAIKYDDAQAFVREKEREQALRDQGYVVVRWLAKEIMLRPADVIGRVSRALGC